MAELETKTTTVKKSTKSSKTVAEKRLKVTLVKSTIGYNTCKNRKQCILYRI